MYYFFCQFDVFYVQINVEVKVRTCFILVVSPVIVLSGFHMGLFRVNKVHSFFQPGHKVLEILLIEEYLMFFKIYGWRFVCHDKLFAFL